MEMNPQLPKSFKGAVLKTSPGQLIVTNLKMPTPEFGQVIVKIEMAGICRSQIMEVKGKRGEDRYLPHLMGHEGVGYVVAIGEGVTKVQLGQKVILGWIKGDGIDSGGSTIQSETDETINAGPVTTFSEYSLVSENRLTPCPKNLPDQLAVLLGCALPTGAGMVLNQVKPAKQSSIVLIGLGGIGVSALLMLQHFNPQHLVVIDSEPSKLDLAKELGATATYLANEGVLEKVQSNYPAGFDYAIESAGRCETIELGFELIHNNGVCFFASHPAHGEKIRLDPHQLICGKQIRGTWGGGCHPDTDLITIADIVQSLDINLDKLTSGLYHLENINSAIEALESGTIVRALVTMQHNT